MEGTTKTLTSLSPTNFLPFDLVAEIMCLLPVKHLLQLRCVCKSWNSLISHDSNFAKKHLRLSTSNLDRHHLILSSQYLSSKLFLSDCSISYIFSSGASFTSLTQLKHPPILNFKGGYCGPRVSTCDSILCVKMDQSSALLWNPSIRKFKILPPLTNPEQKYLLMFTLVYDRFTNNYKIIAISSCNDRSKEVNVHTLGTNYWRRIQDFPNHYHVTRPGIFVSDTANWLAYDRRSSARIIVSLDLVKELSQELSHPLYDYQRGDRITLGVLRDCLCIFSQSDKFSDVWIMKEYGNGQSWTKLLSVPQMGDRYIYTKPLYISEDDQVLMYFLKMRKYSLAFYDSKNDTLNNIHDTLTPSFCIPEVYVENLISPFFQY